MSLSIISYHVTESTHIRLGQDHAVESKLQPLFGCAVHSHGAALFRAVLCC